MNIENVWKMLESLNRDDIILGAHLMRAKNKHWLKSRTNRVRLEKILYELKNPLWDELQVKDKYFLNVCDQWGKWNNGELYVENINRG